MAPTPFRRRKAAKTVRNLAIAEAALAFAKDRALAAAPGRRSRRPTGKLLLLGGAVAAAGAVALLKRDKVAGLLPSRSGEPEHYEPPTPPQPSNYDVPGPVANTATPIPAPDSHERPAAAIDERAEEAAAAAEAAAIGGRTSDYAGVEPGEPADEAHRPLAEAGEGESEGDEQAEADLETNAEFRDDAPSDAERQIEDTIEEAGQPSSGETPETVSDTPDEPPASPSGASDEPASSEAGTQESFLPPEAPSPGAGTDETLADAPGGGISGRPFAGLDKPAAEDEPSPQKPAGGSDEDDSDDWRTWSGRSVKP
jgi:hypothetical protein